MQTTNSNSDNASIGQPDPLARIVILEKNRIEILYSDANCLRTLDYLLKVIEDRRKLQNEL